MLYLTEFWNFYQNDLIQHYITWKGLIYNKTTNQRPANLWSFKWSANNCQTSSALLAWHWSWSCLLKASHSWSHLSTFHALLWTSCATQKYIGSVGWSCRIHQYYLRRGVKTFPTSVLDMTLNNLMVRLQ